MRKSPEKGSIFERNVFNMRLNLVTGLYVPSPRTTSRLKSAMFAVFRLIGDLCVLASLVSYVLGLFSDSSTLTEKCVSLSITLTVLNTTLKMLYMAWRRGEFQEYFQLWNASFQSLKNDRDLRAIFGCEMRLMKLLSIAMILSLAFPPLTSNVMPLIGASQKENGGRYLLIPAWYPFDPLLSPAYEMVVVFRSVSAVLIMSRLVAFDAFLMSLLSLHICQLKHFGLALERVFNEQEEDADDAEEFLDGERHVTWERPARRRHSGGKLYAERLRKCIIYHQKVIRVGNALQDLCSPILLLQFGIMTLVLCFASFVFVAVPLDASRKRMFIMYALSNCGQLFLYCVYGDRVESASSALSATAFGCGWHEKAVLPATRSSLKMLFQRVQTPLRLSALGLYALSAETFLSIVNTAYSYLMVMLEIMS